MYLVNGFVCMSAHACRGQKRVSECLELEFWVVVNYGGSELPDVVTGNQALVPWMS